MERKLVVILICMVMVFVCACGRAEEEPSKIKDMEFTVIPDDAVPEELAKVIEEKKSGTFKMIFHDKEYLYLAVGYGEQESGGYSIAVENLYLAEDAIYIDTTLIGPSPDNEGSGNSYPYVVVKTEFIDKNVIFQ